MLMVINNVLLCLRCAYDDITLLLVMVPKSRVICLLNHLKTLMRSKGVIRAPIKRFCLLVAGKGGGAVVRYTLIPWVSTNLVTLLL